ncbi:MAG: FtsK/SpoIIIE domain-containing protein, partial [Ardenticatenaceae bacterium]|nr:FtsK/SpoIIIE domain-containing protein [Ardenticatenaceae bacterium]
MTEPVYIDRPPRIQPELPFDVIEVPSPPDKDEGQNNRLIQVALPMVTIIGYILIATLGGSGRSPAMLLPMALSVLASVGFSIYSYRKELKRKGEIERAYSDRLVEMNKEMNNYQDMQRRFYRYNYPDVASTLRIVDNTRQEAVRDDRILRTESRLWERRTFDNDFGVVRLGMGTLPSTVLYEIKEEENFDDPQMREARKLAEDSKFVNDIPIIVNFRQKLEEKGDEDDESDENVDEEQSPVTPVTHAMGIAGDKEAVYGFTRGMLLDYAVFHAPMDARLFILAKSQEQWAWTERLPHSLDDDTTTYRCFVEDAEEDEEEVRFDEDDEGIVVDFLEGIRKTLAQRKLRLSENDENNTSTADPTLPFNLLIVDLMDVGEEEGPLSDLESDAAISIILEEGSVLGAAVVFLVPERAKVPSGCHSVIEIEFTDRETGGSQPKRGLYFRYAEIGVNTHRYVGDADAIPKLEIMNQLAMMLAQMDVRQSFGANLTKVVPFLELMGFSSLDDLRDQTRVKWRESIKSDNSDWLRSKIGRMSGNKARTLVFSAKRDGVHGMVAGSTGSGKSELMISMIAAMVVTYDPSVLNFVLVDYKGGGAFKGFDNMPHCVDIITNLEGDAVTRMFTAITSEMQRRQKLNADTGTKNIVDYRQKGLHETHSPYPFLFIIIDEFAEMIADRPEYRSELESITRVGRAQGVSLLLAAQRPTGVTDQMRSNIKFRISLRVETPTESREMLRRNDAAFLPSNIPGRGYLQVGNEEIELIQSAYTGEKYIDPRKDHNQPVLWPDRQDIIFDAADDQEPPILYKAIVDLLEELSTEENRPKQRAPWPDFLSHQLTLSELLISPDPRAEAITSVEYLASEDFITLGREAEAVLTLNPSVNKWDNGENGWYEDDLDWGQYAMRPVVGLVDNPYAANQVPLVVDLPKGHVIIFGASGWGKTTFLRSLVVSLAATHSPNQAHIYVLDLGGRNLTILNELPHVGSVIIPDEEGYEERVEQLLRELDAMIDERKTLLNNVGVPDVYRYNETHSDEPLPSVLVAVDNFVEFRETFGSESDNVASVLDKFVELARQSKSYGIHFALTASRLNDLPNQMFNVFTERLTLKLTDPMEYRAIIGGGQVSDLAEIPGRGYIKLGRLPLSFQIAQPLDLDTGGEELGNENKELAELAQNMVDWIANSDRTYLEPVRVDALPKTILFKQILSRQLNLDLDETFLDNLRATTRSAWANSKDPDKADWLRATLGVISGNRLREMHFEAKVDGVHGMIAGGTGSGKSELLMTLIVSLALQHDPSVLNFVLVDYKGGGAFKPFETMPHVVDSITNLNKAAVKRMFTAIDAEMQRRQKLNADTATKDIVEYRAKGYHLTKGAYPHLFIIIDEYAEMITDNPEFKQELDSITRVGRAQGVNLLLASQRPTGVSDQMRANIKFRICLRVEGIDTSREMLRRSDAAFLPSGMPGRGYMQIGNENIELTQIAYTGESYPYAEVEEGGQKPKFYDVIVKLTQELAGENVPLTPWPPFLPTAMTFSEPLILEYMQPKDLELIQMGRQKEALVVNPFVEKWQKGKGAWYGVDWNKNAMRAIVGLLDDPYNAQLLPLNIDLTRGHVVLFGASGWGKTTFMRSLVMSLASTHSPNEFHAHLLDLGGRNLEVLREIPNVGTVIMPDERGYEERVQQLLRELNDIVDYRKRVFAEVGVSTFYEYNGSEDDGLEPAILIIIDNFNEFLESFGGDMQPDEDSVFSIFVNLLRQAKAYGLHFVISVDRLNTLSSKLLSLFTERLTLRLSDAQSYRSIVGSDIGEIEEIPGRGFTKVGRQALGFQVA